MAENQNLLRDAVTRIPIWTGDSKDVFTPEQWLARIEKARAGQGRNCLKLYHLYTAKRLHNSHRQDVVELRDGITIS